MILGFTGTQNGPEKLQADALELLLSRLDPDECHHGDCVGSDAYFHECIRTLGRAWIIAHPGHPNGKQNDDTKRAHCRADTVHPAMPFLRRNAIIVRSIGVPTGLLVACPPTQKPAHSGTWHTIRLGRSAGVPLVIVYPDGVIVSERLSKEVHELVCDVS